MSFDTAAGTAASRVAAALRAQEKVKAEASRANATALRAEAEAQKAEAAALRAESNAKWAEEATARREYREAVERNIDGFYRSMEEYAATHNIVALAVSFSEEGGTLTFTASNRDEKVFHTLVEKEHTYECYITEINEVDWTRLSNMVPKLREISLCTWNRDAGDCRLEPGHFPNVRIIRIGPRCQKNYEWIESCLEDGDSVITYSKN